MLRFVSGWLPLFLVLTSIPVSGQATWQDADDLAVFLDGHGLAELGARQRLNQLEAESDPVRRFELAMSVTRWLDAQLEREPESDLPSRWIERLEPAVEADLLRFVVSKRNLSQISTRVLAAVFESEQHAVLRSELQTGAREFRTWEQNFQLWEASLRKVDGDLASAPLQDLIQLGRIDIAWCVYYQWLLEPESLDTTELQDARQSLMSLLGIGEPDLTGSQPFRWYEGSDPLERRALLGLTLLLAAEGRLNESNTCLSTLQQKASVKQSAQFLYFQWLSLFRSGAYQNARDLQRHTLDRMASQDRTEAARLALSQLELLEPLLPAETADSAVQAAARDLAGDLVIQLVTLGRVDEAAQWQQDWELLPEGSPAKQVVKLHQAIQTLGLVGQDRRQLDLLAERLETLSRGSNAGIQLWALLNLEKVYQASGARKQELTVLQRRFDLESEPATQQELAWRIAQRLESESKLDLAGQWYDRVALIDWSSSLVPLARLRSRLLNVPGDWRQRVAILRAAVEDPEIGQAARDQLLAEWYGGWKRSQDPDEKKQLADQIEDFLSEMLPLGTALSKDSDISKVAIRIQILESQLTALQEDTESVTRIRKDLILWLDQVYDYALDENGIIPRRDSMTVRQLLLKGLPYWDQAQRYDWILDIRQAFDVKQLTASQAYLLLSYSVRAMLAEGIEKTQRETIRTDAGLLLQWAKDGQLPLSVDSVKSVELTYLRVLRESGATEEAIAWLKALGPDDSRPLRFRIEAGRVLAEGEQWQAAAERWRSIANETLAGTDPWFESQFWLIRSLHELEPEQARVQWQKLQQLYPELPPDWQVRFEELSQQILPQGL